MKKEKEKVKVIVGAPLTQDVLAPDSGILLARKGQIVTREMLARLANWIVEEDPRPVVERTKKREAPVLRDVILKKLAFDEIVSEKTRKDLEKGVDDFFGSIEKKDSKLDTSGIESSIAAMVEETPVNPDVPLRLSELKQFSSHVYEHSIECSIMASFVASAMNYSPQDVTSFVLAMALHDVGVLSLPEGNQDGNRPLTEDDWEQDDQHTRRGWELLKGVPDIEPLALLVALGHHVYADGTGFPGDVDFNDLPPLVYLASIIDTFERLTSPQQHRRAYSLHDAIKQLLVRRERFHPAVLEGFIRAVGIFPISTFVRLNTGEVGVVVRTNPENLFLPEVKLVLNQTGQPYSKEIIVNLINEPVRKIFKVEEKV